MAGQTTHPVTSVISGILPEPMSGKASGTVWWRILTRNQKNGSGSMKKLVSEDITTERLSWLIECVDEMFRDMDENENDTY